MHASSFVDAEYKNIIFVFYINVSIFKNNSLLFVLFKVTRIMSLSRVIRIIVGNYIIMVF